MEEFSCRLCSYYRTMKLTADCHSLGDTLNLPPPPPHLHPSPYFWLSTALLVQIFSLPSLPLPLKSKMAAIIFVKKMLSTRQNYASSAGQLISRSQVLSLVTMLINFVFFLRMPACVTNGNLSLWLTNCLSLSTLLHPKGWKSSSQSHPCSQGIWQICRW